MKIIRKIKKNMQKKSSTERIAITAIIATFSIPIIAVLTPFLLGFLAIFGTSIHLFAPLLWIACSIFGIKYLMGISHKNKLEIEQKKIELEQIEVKHLQEAAKLLDPPN
ncbi:MAG: hypothetical protein COB02_06290 [Candidatus Cloacimonadota bacterium]|nr:MAG: hypothetical protein COB02_06290 [Candidatus Cloacimonadota bacterium]